LTPIEAILIACLVIATVFGGIVFRTRLIYRSLAILLGLMAIVFVLFPNLTTAIARSLGVGRGTDLLLYLSLIAGVYVILLLYRKLRDLERKLTEQIRATALRDAQPSSK
jgi:hypothetical protein